jgi:hypothetical protein
MVLIKKSKWRRGRTRARGITPVLYHSYLFGRTTEDFRAVLVLIPMMNLIRITSHK